MPDYDGNGFISTPDLTGFLTAWEMQVDSVVRGSWEVHCDALMDGAVPLDSVEFHIAAIDIQLRPDSAGNEVLDTAWVDQSWMVTNIPVELNHVRFFCAHSLCHGADQLPPGGRQLHLVHGVQ